MSELKIIDLDLLDIFKKGKIGLISIGVDSLVKVQSALGTQDNEDDNSLYGRYLNWGYIRIFFNEEGISEYADLSFLNKNLKFGEFPCDPMGNVFKIEEKLDFKKLIKFFNYNNIEFKITNSIGDWDIMKITVSKSIDVILRLEDKFILDRITFRK